jgi:hypothetical protein
VSELLSPAPRAELALRAVHAALERERDVEAAVRQALREGTKKQTLASAAERASVAGAVFGTPILRARLAWLLGETDGDWLRSAELLALFLLHESPHRVSRAEMLASLPPESVGLAPRRLAALAALSPRQAVWPAAPAAKQL